MSDDLPVRGGRVHRRDGRRRASGGFSPRRALAALAMLATAGVIWGVVASPVFGVKTVEIEGAVLTGDAAVKAALDLPSPAPNTFVLATDTLRARLLNLPAVADADVSVGLPGTVRVRVTERGPVLAWRRGGPCSSSTAMAGSSPTRRFRELGSGRGGPRAAARRRRADHGEAPAVGGQLDALDLDAATRLLSLAPADVGSTAPSLQVGVNENDGWTIMPTIADPWLAVFGFYGAEIRGPTMIPEQVRLLRSLLAGREATILRVVLAGERQGTFTEKAPPSK